MQLNATDVFLDQRPGNAGCSVEQILGDNRAHLARLYAIGGKFGVGGLQNWKRAVGSGPEEEEVGVLQLEAVGFFAHRWNVVETDDIDQRKRLAARHRPRRSDGFAQRGGATYR